MCFWTDVCLFEGVVIMDYYYKDFYENIKDAEDDIKGEKKWIKECEKKITKLKVYISRETMKLMRVSAMRERPAHLRKCKHDFNICGHTGLGYTGRYCKKCGTIFVDKEYRKFEAFTEIRPEYPFQTGCKHKFLYFHDFVIPVLNVNGRWCKKCGIINEKK